MGGCQSTGTAFIQACGAGDRDLVRCVLERDPRNAEYRTWRGHNSPMLAAAVRGQREVLRLLYMAAVSASGHAKAQRCLDLQNHRGYTPLMAASRNGHSSCVRYLVHCGADPLLKEASRGQTCLHLAAEGSHNNCIVKLLTSGEVGSLKVKESTGWVKFIDSHDDYGMTPLHIAVRSGCISTVWCLLRGGASLSSLVQDSTQAGPYPRGSNVLHIAAAACNTNMVKWLLDFQESHCPGLDLRQKEDSTGLKPFACAAHAGPLAHILLDPNLPYSTISSLWRSRGVMHDRSQWRQEAEIALQRAQLLLQSCVLVLKEMNNCVMVADAIKDIKSLGKYVAEVRSALPNYVASRGDIRNGRFLFSRVSASLGAFESIVNLASNLAKKVLKDGFGEVTADDISVLQSMTASLHARVLHGRGSKAPNHTGTSTSDLFTCALGNPALRTLLSSSLLEANNHDSISSDLTWGSFDRGSGHLQEAYKNSGIIDEHNSDYIIDKEDKDTSDSTTSLWSGHSVGESIVTQDALCAICMDKREEIRFKRCGHRMCLKCSIRLCSQYSLQESTFVKCPFCRQLVVGLSPLTPMKLHRCEGRPAQSCCVMPEPVMEGELVCQCTNISAALRTVDEDP